MGNHGLSFTIRGERVASLNVLSRQVWEVIEYLRLCHSCRQIAKDIVNRYTHAPNAGFPPSFSGFNCYDISVAHEITVTVSS